MSQPFKIQKPIKDLATLRQEKLRLKQHIKTADLEMREKVQSWPLLTALHGAQKVGKVLFESNLAGMAGGLLGFKSGKKGFMSALTKAALLFAGTKIIKHFAEAKSKTDEAATDIAGDEIDTFAEEEPAAGAD